MLSHGGDIAEKVKNRGLANREKQCFLSLYVDALVCVQRLLRTVRSCSPGDKLRRRCNRLSRKSFACMRLTVAAWIGGASICFVSGCRETWRGRRNARVRDSPSGFSFRPPTAAVILIAGGEDGVRTGICGQPNLL